MITIIIPTLNEESCMEKLERNLSTLEGEFEVILVDGGSTDRTLSKVPSLARVIKGVRGGRGAQLNRGEEIARGDILSALRQASSGVNVHYIPVHIHSFYRRRFGTGLGLCPVTEAIYEQILSLPIFPAMTDHDLADVIAAVRKVANSHRVRGADQGK